jgi:hypothetical protein
MAIAALALWTPAGARADLMYQQGLRFGEDIRRHALTTAHRPAIPASASLPRSAARPASLPPIGTPPSIFGWAGGGGFRGGGGSSPASQTEGEPFDWDALRRDRQRPRENNTVPEPASATLVTLGALAMLARRRKPIA